MLIFLIAMVCLLLVAGALIVFLLHEPKKSQRMRRGQCTRCGYDMLHLEHTTCPECGHRWEDD